MPPVDVAHSAARRPLQSPRIKWLEIAAGWALAVVLQLVLLFLGFGLGAGAIDLRSAGEELRQQVASALVADRSVLPAAPSVPAAASKDVQAYLPSPSIGRQLLDHAGPVLLWLAVGGAITWLAWLFNNATRSPSSAE